MKPPPNVDGSDSETVNTKEDAVQNPAIPTPLTQNPMTAQSKITSIIDAPSTSGQNTSNSNSVGTVPEEVLNVAAEAAKVVIEGVLASSTVEYALNAAVQSVLHHSGALDSTDTSPDSVVSADSASGLVYVEQQMESESKTDAEKTQDELMDELHKYL